MNTLAKPFLKWAGGKRALVPRILPHVPASIETYFEPFLGGGALFFALAAENRFNRSVLSDANEELVRTWLAIQRDVDKVLRVLDGHRHSLRHFKRTRDQDPAKLSDAACAARMIFLNRTCFNGIYRVNASGKFNVPFGRYKRMRRFARPEALRAAARALDPSRVRIIREDFGTAVRLAPARPGDFVYFDPPYVPVSPTSTFTSFTAGGFDGDDQEVLGGVLEELRQTGVAAVLSNSDCQLTRHLYRHFKYEVVSRSGGVSSKVSKRGRVAELIVTTEARR